MAKFHISDDGEARSCAAKDNCPLGENAPHGDFKTLAEAKVWAESVILSQMDGAFGSVETKTRMYHYNPATGKGAACSNPQKCPLRIGTSNHFPSKETAREKFAANVVAARELLTSETASLEQVERAENWVRFNTKLVWEAQNKNIKKRDHLFQTKGFSAAKEGLLIEKRIAETNDELSALKHLSGELYKKSLAVRSTLKPVEPKVIENHGWFKEYDDGSYVLPRNEHCPRCGRNADEDTPKMKGNRWVCYH